MTPNTLQRGFTVPRPNTAWVTNSTYVHTWEGLLYLAVVMDLDSRRIVGWSTKPTLAQDLVLDALLMAVRRHKPQHVLIHSDQGSQFDSDAWRCFCRAHHLEPSMSRRGNCWDNAVAESFFSSLKKEQIKKRIYITRAMAMADSDEYIETFYNRIRRHSTSAGSVRRHLKQCQTMLNACAHETLGSPLRR
ncbi:MAG: IS3 family transposase [Nitrospira sp.]|nr:IS3 family transposase [Nitrospira sp.]